VCWERRAPQHWCLVGTKDDAAHAWFGSIACPYKAGGLGYKFSEASGSLGETLCEALEVVDVAADVLGDFHSVLVGMLDPKLKSGEQAL